MKVDKKTKQSLISWIFLCLWVSAIFGFPTDGHATEALAATGDVSVETTNQPLDDRSLGSESEAGAVRLVPVATDARISGDWKRTRFIVDLTRGVPVRAFALPEPYRVIVDLPEVAFRLPPGRGQESRGLVSAYRYGLFAPGKSRIVLDVANPVRIDRAYVLPAKDGEPARLVVDLIETDVSTFANSVAASASLALAYPRPNTAKKSSRLQILPQPRPNLAEEARAEKPVIVIDPGHGGVDPGAISKRGLQEKQVTLEFANQLRQTLLEDGRFDIVMTRTKDSFIPLAERVQIARNAAASLFISVHADSFRTGAVRGATIYTLSERASDASSAALAESENAADMFAGLAIEEEDEAVSDILADLMRRETKNLSILFARTAIEELKLVTRMNKNPHRFAGFRVLKAPDVPSVLLELGYMSNESDVKRMMDPKWRERTAASLLLAARRFLRPQITGALDSQ